MRKRSERISDWESLIKDSGYRPKELASVAQVSLRTLERFWLKKHGQSPQVWLARRRLEEAKSLLVQPLSVKEVAFLLGFKQSSHFSAYFKKSTWLNPSQFGFS